MAAIDFSPPSYRAAGSDLTISISPLGLVELADEEFEVHGPRLNRYSLNWAMYLGHHWSYRREIGESQLTYNYFKAFTDYMTNFCFGKGVQFKSPKATEAIVPDILKRVWEVDNNKQSVLWEMGQQGGVSGDCFVKVAYEDGYVDAAGFPHPGRIRILPLNSSFCFPEFHPHDRSRLIRFKLKYRFWGTSLEGTRQVYTYTEILTDDQIEEYVNDELIDSRPNPLGVIPVIHTPNVRVSGSPWGLPDCADIIPLNRQYNETSTDISDIINYHAAPVTVIVGAKAANLEKGPKKVWGGLPKDANVFNLQGTGDIPGAMAFLENLKISMHEMVGIPETALGQAQPISNTSGVALSIQFQPLMNKYSQKITQYKEALERINDLVLRQLVLKEPELFVWNPDTDIPLKPGQYDKLDPADPLTYQSYAHFESPLPLDRLIALNEIQALMAMGLESKEGALRVLGEEFPEQKLAEIREEQLADAKNDGILKLVMTQIDSAIMNITGMVPGVNGGPAMPVMDPGAEGESPTGPATAPIDPNVGINMDEVFGMENFLVTQAYGTKLAQRRVPDEEPLDK